MGAEPHYCETYADLVTYLQNATPEFPSEDGAKPATFKSALLNVVQNEFEAMPQTLAPPPEEENELEREELQARASEQKKRFLANMRFIGNLFLRQLLPTKIIAGIMQELLCIDSPDHVPEEHVVECVCELLRNVGWTLESTPVGKSALIGVCGRMKDLKGVKRKDGTSALLKRIQFAISDVLDARAAGWVMKSFNKTAKTKAEVRLEQAKTLPLRNLNLLEPGLLT